MSLESSPRIFCPVRRASISTFEAFLKYYEKTIFKKTRNIWFQESDFQDLVQEIHIRLLSVWRKFQAKEIKYLSSKYVNRAIETCISDFVSRASSNLDVSFIPFKKHNVISLEEIDLDIEKHEKSFENRILFEEKESKVLRNLTAFELSVYDRVKQGKTRQEIFKELRFSSVRRYLKILHKIRKLFQEYS